MSSRTLEVAIGVMQAMFTSKQRIFVIVLLMGGLSGLASTSRAADNKPESPKKAKEETPLETLLRKWAEADEKTQEMHVRFTRTDTDRVYETSSITKGRASIKKPDLWRIDRLDKQARMLDV
jgi:outer membrane lipoprotein-sorting protein